MGGSLKVFAANTSFKSISDHLGALRKALLSVHSISALFGKMYEDLKSFFHILGP